MNIFIKIPEQHRYKRILEIINKRTVSFGILNNIFTFIQKLIAGAVIVIIIVLIDGAVIYIIDLFSENNDSLDLFILTEALITIFIISLVIFLYRKLISFRKRITNELLEFWCKMLISKRWIDFIIDPKILELLRIKPKELAWFKKLDISFDYFQSYKHSNRFNYYFGSNQPIVKFMTYIVTYLYKIPLHRAVKFSVISRLVLWTNFQGFYSVLAVIIYLIDWIFKTKLVDNITVVSCIFIPYLFLGLSIYLYYQFILSLSIRVIRAIILVTMLRDPDNDYSMFSFKDLDPALDYYATVKIIESYLYTGQYINSTDYPWARRRI